MVMAASDDVVLSWKTAVWTKLGSAGVKVNVPEASGLSGCRGTGG